MHQATRLSRAKMAGAVVAVVVGPAIKTGEATSRQTAARRKPRRIMPIPGFYYFVAPCVDADRVVAGRVAAIVVVTAVAGRDAGFVVCVVAGIVAGTV